MRNRIAMIATTLTAGLLITGIAWAAQSSNRSDDSTTTTSQAAAATSATAATATTQTTAGVPSSTSSTAATSTTAASTAGTLNLAGGQVVEYPVGAAGFVSLRQNGSTLTVVSTRANSGWVVEVEVAQGREVEGDFRSGGQRVKWNFELEDGVVRVRVEADDSSGGSSTSSTTSTTSPTATTNTTAGSAIPNGPVVYSLDGAGTVTVIFSSTGMSIGSINPAAGWTVVDTQQSSDEIEVEVRNGEQEIELKVEIEGGQVRVTLEHKS